MSIAGVSHCLETCRQTLVVGMGKQRITIYADFGNGPYAWLQDDSETGPQVGTHFADCTRGLSEIIGTSKELDNAFNEWTLQFERYYDDPEFDWNLMHEEGMNLARRLNREIGDRFVVAYRPPHEDESRRAISRIVIEDE